jgi:hypothetical protein
MQLFTTDATIFKKIIKFSFAHKKLKSNPQKLLRKTQIHFFPYCPELPKTAQTEEFRFQNVAYRPTVYRTGILVIR